MGVVNGRYKVMVYDQEIVKLICKDIREGVSPRTAAVINGVPDATFYDWLKGRPDFAAAVNAARADLRASLEQTVRTAARQPKNWIAAMTMLERLWPEDYGRSTRVRHSVEGEVGLNLRPALASPETIALLGQLDEQLGSVIEGEGVPLLDSPDDDSPEPPIGKMLS